MKTMAYTRKTLLLSALLIFAFVDADYGTYSSSSPKIFRPNSVKPPFKPGPWKEAHATFYGGMDGSGTKGGACGYEDPFELGYGLQTVAVSSALFNGGLTCGACYEIKCPNGTQYSKGSSIIVTATNLCGDDGQRCSPSMEHFDLTQPAFLQIAEEQAGIVPIHYRRVPCKKQGGVRYMITGNDNYNLVTITNVGGAGDIVKVEVKGSQNLPWMTLKRNWGQKWQADAKLTGRKLTFKITTSDGKTLTSRNLMPESWQFGVTYTSNKNFGHKHMKH